MSSCSFRVKLSQTLDFLSQTSHPDKPSSFLHPPANVINSPVCSAERPSSSSQRASPFHSVSFSLSLSLSPSLSQHKHTSVRPFPPQRSSLPPLVKLLYRPEGTERVAQHALREPVAAGDLPPGPGSGPLGAGRPGPVPQPLPLPRRPSARHLRRRRAEEDPPGVGGHPLAEPAEEQPGSHPHGGLRRKQGAHLPAHAALPAPGGRIAGLQGAEEAHLPLPVPQRDQQHQARRLRGPDRAHVPLPAREPDRRAGQGHLLPHGQPLHPAAQRQQAPGAATGDLLGRQGLALAAHERQRAGDAAAGLPGRRGEPRHPPPGREQDVQLPHRGDEQAAGGGGAHAGEEPHEDHPRRGLPELRPLHAETTPGPHGSGEVLRRCVHWCDGHQGPEPGQQQAEVSPQKPRLQHHHQPHPLQQPLELHVPARSTAQVDGLQSQPFGRSVRISASAERKASERQRRLQGLQGEDEETLKRPRAIETRGCAGEAERRSLSR